MKHIITKVFLLIMIVGIASCDRFNPVDPINLPSAGHVILLNKSTHYPMGLDTLNINEGATLELHLNSLLNKSSKSYSWETESSEILNLNIDKGSDTLATVKAAGKEGQSTNLIIQDIVNDVTKIVPVKIVKYWADPALYVNFGEHNGHHYYISKYKKTWTAAKEACEKYGTDKAHLVTVNSMDENVFINENRQNEPLWIGLTFLYGNDDLSKWITGDDITFENWLNSTNPNLPGTRPTTPGMFSQNYIHMSTNGFWTQASEKNLYYILEFDKY